MPPDESEDVFKVTDRRRRLDADDPPHPGSASDESRPPAPPSSATPGERSLAGIFMMLSSSTVVARGHAPDPPTGQRQTWLGQAPDRIDLPALRRGKREGTPAG